MVGTSRIVSTSLMIGSFIAVASLVVCGLILFYRSRKKSFNFPAPPKHSISFKDVAGTIPAEIKLLASMINNPERYARVGAQLPKGILLVGPPGSGKTLLAQALAGETKGNFLYIAASDFVEVYAGTGAKKVRELFEKAYRLLHPAQEKGLLSSYFSTPEPVKAAPAVIIFIDEIDALGIRGSETSENRQTINQLLTCMDGFQSHENIVVVAATNHPSLIDPALVRSGRFDYIVTLSLPNTETRQAMIAHHLKDKPYDKAINITQLAEKTKNCSGADIRSVVNVAAHKAAKANASHITQQHLEQAVEVILKKKQQEPRISNQPTSRRNRRR